MLRQQDNVTQPDTIKNQNMLHKPEQLKPNMSILLAKHRTCEVSALIYQL